LQVYIAGSKEHAVGAQRAPSFKPDFTMTNSGLHIQLPINQLIAGHRSSDSNDLSSVLANLHLAFLACKCKQKDCLVAVWLLKDDRATFPSYCRVPFDGRTIHHLDQSLYKQQSIQIEKFVPGWISKAPKIDIFDHSKKLPLSVKTVRFEMWYKGSHPVVNLCWSGEPEGDRRKQLDEPSKLLHHLGDQVPEVFMDLAEPLQHYINTSIATSGFAHEVISFQHRNEVLGGGPGYAAIAFGVIDRHLWMATPIAKAHQSYRSLFQDFIFPSGASWSKEGCSAFCILPDSQGTFRTQLARDSPVCYAHYVTLMENPGELSFRIYLSPVARRTKSWMGRLW
jgi:hypothetical protein